MAEFLLEIFSEEIPARMQKRAMEDLAKLVTDALAKNGIQVQNPKSWVAPRRIGLCIENLPTQTPEVREEKKGPKLGAPQPAIDGFIRAAGINSIDEARIENDPKKGDFYVVDIVKPGSKTTDILANALPQIIQSFPWPKSMRWGTGNLRWVRPIHSIIALFDGALVDFEIEGIKSCNKTEGHRFHGNGVFEVSNFADYQSKIANANVIIDREERKAEITRQINDICAANNLELIEDIGLLEEVCGLVDKPVVILGQMDESFLDLPPEVIRLTLRVNQKYFVLNSKATGKLAPNFIMVSNVAATDGGKAIAHGNARVLAARLNDARYFWDLDRKTSLESRVEKLGKIVFHQKIGSIGDKVNRIVELAGELAPIVGADFKLSKRAALLSKADLVTEMVGEFPELQGVMGRYYATLGTISPPQKLGEGDHAKHGGGVQNSNPPVADGDSPPIFEGQRDVEHPDVANAIMEHYKPVGPSDYVPTNPVSIAVALADKFDTLVSFFAIGEKPTGSGDPYALRRAALGIIRIILENNLRLPLGRRVNDELQSFFLDRLKVYLRDEGYSLDIIDAVFAKKDDDLVLIVNRIKALSEFLKTEDGANLLAGFKRATNILKAEEKKGENIQNLVVDAQHLQENAEKSLFAALQQNEAVLTEKLQKEDFAGAMKALSQLRAPVYDFLDNVLVNDSDNLKRLNRLALLSKLSQQMANIADFEMVRS